jgi:hypothetical protein
METSSVPTLTASDRCDICGAQAFIRVKLENGELMFCGHHGNANKEKLQPIMIDWHDQTSAINRTVIE